MHVGVEVGGVRAERPDRDHETRRDVVAIEDRANAGDDRVAGRAGEQSEQAPLALEQPAQDARNREHDLAQRPLPRLVAFLVLPDVAREVLLEQPVDDGALGEGHASATGGGKAGRERATSR